MLPIAISLSPNTEPEDVQRAVSLLSRFWRYRECKVQSSKFKVAVQNSKLLRLETKDARCHIAELENSFKRYFDVPFAWNFNSGRSALYILLKSLGIGVGDEVLLQAFTCNAVPNPVLWVQAEPVYVDIEGDTYNIDPADLEKKITPRAKALIIQHTFGIPADLERIMPIARKHGLFVIEDCAHALGGTYSGKQHVVSRDKTESFGAVRRSESDGGSKQNIKSHEFSIQHSAFSIQKLGTFGDAAFFSFGRDKVISSVYGGVLITKNADLAEKIDAEYEKLLFPSRFWVFQQLLHPVIFAVALPLYKIGIGKLIVWCAQKLRLLSKAVTLKERTGGKPEYFPKRLPEALADLALLQFKRLETFNTHRRAIAHYYKEILSNTRYQIPDTRCEDAVWLRFPVQHPRASEIIQAARKKGIYLGDWYREVIAPAGTDFQKMRYRRGSCPVAEDVAKYIINLPTHPRCTLSEAREVVDLLLRFSE